MNSHVMHLPQVSMGMSDFLGEMSDFLMEMSDFSREMSDFCWIGPTVKIYMSSFLEKCSTFAQNARLFEEMSNYQNCMSNFLKAVLEYKSTIKFLAPINLIGYAQTYIL